MKSRIPRSEGQSLECPITVIARVVPSTVCYDPIYAESYSTLKLTISKGSAPLTEAVLTENFKTVLSKSLRSQGSSNGILLDELDGLQGRADLVVARIDFKSLPDVPCLEDLVVTLSSPAKARLLAMLRYGAPRTRSYLARVTGFSDSSLGSHIRQLESAGLARVHGNSSLSLNYRLPWSMVDIESYEVKLYNWRRALHQAMGYRSFSHSVGVVMPPPGAQCAKKLTPVFHNTGIGLISIENDGGTRIEIRSKKHCRPASRRLYLMAVGVILSRYLEEKALISTPQT